MSGGAPGRTSATRPGALHPFPREEVVLVATENAPERIYRNRTGDLVPGSDPGAASLAYAEGDEMAPDDAAAWKKRKAPADKQRRTAANKAGTAKKPAADGALPPEKTPDGDQADVRDVGTGSGLKVETGSATEPGTDPKW